MSISSNILDQHRGHQSRIKTYLKQAIQHTDAEFEFIYGEYENTNKIDKIIFLRLLNNLKQKYECDELNLLDIRTQEISHEGQKLSNIRCTIQGISDIKKYCKTNSIDDLLNLSFVTKKDWFNPKMPDVKFYSIKNADYNYRINLKKEEAIDNYSLILSDMKHKINNSLKYYRYKKRFSFITEDKLFRIDLTAVKSNDFIIKKHKDKGKLITKKEFKLYESLIESKVLHNEETYELEIEYIGSQNYKGVDPIDLFIEKFNTSDESNANKYNVSHKKESTNVSNIYSELNFTESIEEKQVLEDIDEFNEYHISNIESELFPFRPEPITSDPMYDIHYDYWVNSNQEWLYEAIVFNDRELHYESTKKNITGNYPDAPEKTDYIEYRIYPEFTDEEKEQNKYFPDDFNGILLIPLSNITGSSEYKKEKQFKLPSWAPELQKEQPVKKSKESEESEESEEEKIEMDSQVNWTFDHPELPNHRSGYVKEIKGDDILVEDSDSNSGWFNSSQLRLNIWEPEIIEPEALHEHNIAMGLVDNRDEKQIGNIILDNLLIVLNQIIKDLLIHIHNSDLLVTKTKKDEILIIYENLTEQNVTKKRRLEFKGPNPVSLSLNELLPSNQHSILSKYVVTEKADGIRAQLIISSKECYLITQKLEVIDMGLKCDNISGVWLFDGEYITKNKKGDSIELFMIFDVYYAADGGTDITYPNHAYTYPWINVKRSKKDINRSSILNDFKNKVSFIPKSDSKYTMIVGYKTYYEGPKLLKQSKKDPSKYSNISKMGQVSKKILDLDKKEDGYGYRIDGLIYLPMFLSVNSLVEGEQTNLGGQWDVNYKWKPPEENSIDFKVKIIQEKLKDKITTTKINGKVKVCKQVHLYVGYKYYEDPNYDYVWKILTNSYQKPPKEVLFQPKSNKDIYIVNIPLTNDKLLCSRDKVEIKNDMILEMQYEGKNPDGSKWTPLRHRSDKTYPNKLSTADNVWSTIMNPVTEKMITGKKLDTIEELVKENVEDERYYKDHSKKNEYDIPLRELHNYIKSKLITSICSIGDDPISIMDTSVGRGGDIKKYLSSKNRINFFFGLDLNSDVTKEAAKRYYNEYMKKPRAVFMQYDTSELIKEGNGFVGSKEDIERNKILINLLYSKRESVPKKYKEIQKKYNDLGSRGFNIISSQFTLHYYFENEQKLRNFIQNLSDNCKPNGYFIGTCYDGMKVFNTLKEKDDLTMIDEFNNKVYSIVKNYEIESFDYKQDDLSNMFGQEIKVEMSSIGQEITEYLVNFQFFVEIMKEYNFKLVSPDLKGKFSGIFDTKDFSYQKGMGGFDQIIHKLSNLSSKDMTLKKNYIEALEILKEKNVMLRELSALNNWFIFQKQE